MKLKHFIKILEDFAKDDIGHEHIRSGCVQSFHVEIIDKNGDMQRVKGVDVDTELGENNEEVVKIEFWT